MPLILPAKVQQKNDISKFLPLKMSLKLSFWIIRPPFLCFARSPVSSGDIMLQNYSKFLIYANRYVIFFIFPLPLLRVWLEQRSPLLLPFEAKS